MAIMPSLVQQHDATYTNVQSVKWWCVSSILLLRGYLADTSSPSLIHTYVAIICACMPLLHSYARHRFPRLFPTNEGHGQGLVLITRCNISLPSTDPEASPVETMSNLDFGHGKCNSS